MCFLHFALFLVESWSCWTVEKLTCSSWDQMNSSFCWRWPRCIDRSWIKKKSEQANYHTRLEECSPWRVHRTSTNHLWCGDWTLSIFYSIPQGLVAGQAGFYPCHRNCQPPHSVITDWREIKEKKKERKLQWPSTKPLALSHISRTDGICSHAGKNSVVIFHAGRPWLCPGEEGKPWLVQQHFVQLNKHFYEQEINSLCKQQLFFVRRSHIVWEIERPAYLHHRLQKWFMWGCNAASRTLDRPNTHFAPWRDIFQASFIQEISLQKSFCFCFCSNMSGTSWKKILQKVTYYSGSCRKQQSERISRITLWFLPPDWCNFELFALWNISLCTTKCCCLSSWPRTHGS